MKTKKYNVKEIMRYASSHSEVFEQEYIDFCQSKNDEEINLLIDFCCEFSFRWSPDESVPNGVCFTGGNPLAQELYLKSISLDGLKDFIHNYDVLSETEDYLALTDSSMYEIDSDGEKQLTEYAQSVYDEFDKFEDGVMDFIRHHK